MKYLLFVIVVFVLCSCENYVEPDYIRTDDIHLIRGDSVYNKIQYRGVTP